jgi:anti-sigma-K factor RskA
VIDIKAYIESGVIESYVLGLSTPEEMAETEQLRQQFSEVEQAIQDFEMALEQQAIANAVPPPAGMKAALMAELAAEFAEPVLDTTLQPGHHTEQEAKGLVRNMVWMRYAVAASLIFFIVSAAFNMYLYNQLEQTDSKYQALLNEQSTLQANNDRFQTKLQEYQSSLAMMTDPAMLKIKMDAASAGKTTTNEAILLWDTRTKDVYVMAKQLPQATADQQYQLWAIVDGNPVDAGLLDPNCTAICKLKNIQKAQAFAITLEAKGGSPTPHLEQLQVLGKVG